MTWWGCPACGGAVGVRPLAGCPRCTGGGPGLVSIVNHREFVGLRGKEAVLAYLAELAKEAQMPKTTVHSRSSNGSDEPVALAEGGRIGPDAEPVLEPGPAALVVPPKPADVRAWAAGAGVDVKPTGPLPAAVVEAYRQAVST